jgi:hypothetical protein
VLIQPGVYRNRNAAGLLRGGTKQVTGILTGTRFFRLRKAIRVSQRQEDGVWICDCAALGIHAYGETKAESWKGFIDIFECDWDSIAGEKDSRLTRGAQALKRKYLDLVQAVEPIL